MSEPEDAPRVLVEGGPIHRRMNRVLAITIGWMIGGGLGIAGTAYVALKAAHDVGAERRNSIIRTCHEANRRHAAAKVGLEIVATRSALRNPTLTDKERHDVLEAFVQALVPKYNCEQRLKELS